MSIFGKLFGTDKHVDNLIDKEKGLIVRAGQWIGNMHYTDEEKAEADLLIKKWGIRQLEALEPFKIVQRILAFAVAFMWIFGGLNLFTAVWVEAIYNTHLEIDQIPLTITPHIKEFIFSDYILWPTVAVFSLYFTGGVINSVSNIKKPDK